MPRSALARGAAAAWALGLMARPCQAAEPHDLNLKPVDVPGRRQAPIDPAPARIQVLAREALRDSGALNLGELLSRRGGLAVGSYGAVGALAPVTWRGFGSARVLVTRDGARLNSPERGGADLGALGLAGLDRVTLTPGAGGLAGPNALGGSIDLAPSAHPGGRIASRLGSFGLRAHMVEHGGLLEEGGDWRFSLAKTDADNQYAYLYREAPAIRQNAAFDGLDGSFALRGLPLGELSLEGWLTGSRRLTGVPGPENYPTPRAGQDEHDLQGLVRLTRPWSESVSHLTSLSHRHSGLSFSNLNGTLRLTTGGVFDVTEAQSRLEAEGWQLQTGLLREGAGGQALGGGRERWSGYLGGRFSFAPAEHWLAEASARLDASPSFGLAPAPRFGLSFLPTPNAKVYLAGGGGYRPPAFNDLYWPQTGASVGNPALRPETAWNAEVGAAFEADWGQGSFALFGSRALDAIVWQPGFNAVWSPRNVGAVETLGLEAGLEARWTLLDARLDASVADARDRSRADQGRLPYQPLWNLQGEAGLSWPGDWRWALGLTGMGERFTTAANTVSLPAVSLLHAEGRWRYDPQTTFLLRVDNLLDAAYRIQPNYPMPGRAFSLTLARTY